MKLSTKVRYGARALLDLAQHYDNTPVLLKDIAKRQDISLKYLDRILSSLRAAGIVKTVRGAKGGYVLAKPPSEVNLRQIVEAIEGRLELVECLRNKNYCKRVNSCVMHDIWDELGDSMDSLLARTTLESLMSKEKEKLASSEKMYYI